MLLADGKADFSVLLASRYGLIQQYSSGFKSRPTKLFLSARASISACNCVQNYGKRNDWSILGSVLAKLERQFSSTLSFGTGVYVW